MKIILNLVLLLLFITGFGCQNSSANSTDKQYDITCQRNNDCVLIKADCCGCNNGGQNIAISTPSHKALKEIYDNKCQNIACIMMMSNHKSCKHINNNVEAICINNKCCVGINDNCI